VSATRFAILAVGLLAAASAHAAAPAHATQPAPTAAATDAAATTFDADEDAKARAWFTDTVLVTQDGKEVRFYSDVIRDTVVVVDFIFTRCAGACPILTEKLKGVRRELGDLFGSKVRFVSISIDPEFDTPQELVSFAKKHRAEHPEWLFLTGKKADVKTVVSRLGQWTEAVAEHSTLFIAGNARERHWTKIRLDTGTEAFALQVKKLLGDDGALLPAGAPAATAAQ
jgi:cytochrome oxidase Cu insertion factor (SCO1/SenC/PrrC family)